MIAVEENYWADAMDQDLVDNFLPSDLVPNQAMVLDIFKHEPTSIAFQSTAFPGVVYSKDARPWMKKLMDLADPRLKGKVTLPPPGDITNGGLFLGLASELGKDYKDAAQMKEVVDWAVANIGPNVLKYTPDSAEMQQLLRSGAADAVSFWNSLARLEYFGGNTDAALLVPANMFPVNGYLWIPKGAAHPVLAQVFINWRLGTEVQFPNAGPSTTGRGASSARASWDPITSTTCPSGSPPTTSTTSRPWTRSRPFKTRRLAGVQRRPEGVAGLLRLEDRPVD